MLPTCIDRTIGRGVTLALSLALAACGNEQASSASGTDTGGPTTAGPSTGMPTTTAPTTTAPSTGTGTDATATATATATTMGAVTQTTGDTSEPSSGTTGALCPADAIVCDGDLAQVCDGMGGFTSEMPCPGGCVDGQGCTVCAPNSQACDGEHAIVCNAEGSEQTVTLCDGVQGVTCEDGQCVGACSAFELGESYIGCDYYPTVTANIVEDVYHFAVAVANTSDLEANLEIDKDGMLVLNATVAPNSVEVITLPWDYALKANQFVEPASLKAEGGAYRLRSDQPVTVYQYNPLEYELQGLDNSFTNDASLLLPVNVWTGDYFVVARNTWDVFDAGVQIAPGFYTVTASEDDTTVELLPSETGKLVIPGGGVLADGTGKIKLDQGDVLEVFSALTLGNPGKADVTGTRIKADRPIQVISGHVCTNVPHDIDACDHLEESMYPYETLAKQYIVTPPLIPTGGNVPKAQMVRIVATQDGTTLTYDPPQNGAPTMIATAGQYVEIQQTSADFEVSANNKIIIGQYMLGQEAGGGSGDPAMALSVATEQYRNNYLFHAPVNYDSNFVNITAPMTAKVTLDGAPVVGFKAIGATGFGVARLELGDNIDGNHDIQSDKPVGISVYGYGKYTSYWYPGGLDLTVLPQ
ncbi:MAG: IgGFc-binding protein [Nannocystis sp.]|nr:IgGFc-binding protein [Nannocystis sp.]MBA3549995.1 IgGFc-binding protein [Nannocystis sp.]